MGESGEVTGPNKVGAWKAFEALLRERGMVTRADQEELGFYVDFPTSKKDAYQVMKKVDGGLWVLPFHFHT